MNSACATAACGLAVAFCLPPTARATTTDIPALVRTIKSVGPEGAGSGDAARAWQQLSRQPAADLPQLLAALDDTSPAAANWLRSAIDAIVERETAAGHALPAAGLASFLRDRTHSARGRRLAYELICRSDPTASKRLLPTMLDDPAPELRFDAVAAAFDAVKSQPADSTSARQELRKLLTASRDGHQIEEIAKELDRRGDPVDLVAHFGFITRWLVAGPFDNTGGRGFQTAFPPESGVDLASKYTGKDGAEVHWRPGPSADKSGAIDLNQIFPDPAGKRKGLAAAVTYAYAEVESPIARDVDVRASGATAMKVFVNAREVLAREIYHQNFDRDLHAGPARLAKGRNTILVKVCQNDQDFPWSQNWLFQVRLTDSLGAAVPIKVVTPRANGEGAK
jgi:hypothetical protein